MKKVFFIIPTLTGGGAERVMIHLLKHVDRNRFQPGLVLFEKKGPLLDEVPSDVVIHSLGKEAMSSGLKWVKTARKLARLMEEERPAAALSFMWYTNSITLLASKWSKIGPRVIASERTNFTSPYEGRLVETLRRICVRTLYPKADCILAVSEGIRKELLAFNILRPEKVFTVYNPVDITQIVRLSREKADHPWLEEDRPLVCAMGRLEPKKGFSHLLRAMAKVDGPRLMILGGGPEERSLKKEAERLGIEDRVALLGHQANPYSYLGRADLFALPSLCEGFPNALLEAMALGIPCVAARCPTGPEEIITHGKNGLLVPPADADALAKAMASILAAPESLAREGRGRAEDFRMDRIVERYEQLIEASCAASAEN